LRRSCGTRPRVAEPALGKTRIEQSGTEMGALYTLVASLAVRKLLVLGSWDVTQVGGCMRKRRLLAEQQEQR